MPRHAVDGIVYDEIDGVAAMWPEGRRSGEPWAMLAFRVGQADETLQTRGITHLIEHLALVRTGQAPHAYNGRTGPTITSFGMQGTGTDLVSFFETLGTSLQDLPLDRLDIERGVLATEENGRNSDAEHLFRLRWGPRGYGLMGYREYGAQRVHGEALRAWSAEWFNRGNALLVLNGPPPRGLRLPLPEGEWKAPPEPAPAIDPTPASFPMHNESFGLSVVRERVPGGNESAWLVSERLNQRLRFQLGLVYGVNGGTAAYTPSWRHDIYWTHALPEKLASAGAALVDVLADIAGPLTDAERAAWQANRRRAAEARTTKDANFAYLQYVHEEWLLGGEVQSKDELLAASDGMTEEVLLDLVRENTTRMLLALPDGVDGTRVAAPIPQHSELAVSGRVLSPAHGQQEELVLADTGVSLLQLPARKPITVQFKDVAGVLAWDDGSRTLLGNDGFAVAYRPELWAAKAGEVITHIDSRVDHSLFIGLGARTPVEKPAAAAAPAPSSSHARARRAAWRVNCAVLFLFTLSALSAIFDPQPATSQDDAGPVATAVTMVVFVLAAAVWPTLRLFRWSKRRKT